MPNLKLSFEQVEQVVNSFPSGPESYRYMELLLRLPYGVYVEVMERLYTGEITLGVLNQQLHTISTKSGMPDLVVGSIDSNKVSSNIMCSAPDNDRSLSSLIISGALNLVSPETTLPSDERLPALTNESQKREYLGRILDNLDGVDREFLEGVSLAGTDMNLLGISHELRVLFMDLDAAKGEYAEWERQHKTVPNDSLRYCKMIAARERVYDIYRLIEKQVIAELSVVTSI